MESHPLRVRGLKHLWVQVIADHVGVASFTGAWIETPMPWGKYKGEKVASFTGAWIETIQLHIHKEARSVASFTGAWIETSGTSLKVLVA